MYYETVTEEDLLKLRDGLMIMGRVIRDSGTDMPNLWLYGLTDDPIIIDAAKEAIAEMADDEAVTEETVKLAEIAVGIAANEDTIYYLTGSGLILRKDEIFTYLGGKGEGYRQLDFNWSHIKPTVNLSHFKRIALANDDAWLDRFLQQYGSKIPAEIQKQVTREIPATAPTAPAPQVPQQKQTSLNVENVVEKWLG
jgi:hypothetical protein